MTATASIALPGLVKRLVDHGKLDMESATEHVSTAKQKNKSIVSYLIQSQAANQEDVALACSCEYGISTVDLDAINITLEVEQLIQPEKSRQWNLLPLFKHGTGLYVGVADPAHLDNLDDVNFATGLVAEPIIVEYDKLQMKLQPTGSFQGSSQDAMRVGMTVSNDATAMDLAVSTENIDAQAKKQEEESDDDSGIDITKFVDDILSHAIQKGVSDIHIEPYEKLLRIRFRVDGILQVVATPPKKIARKFASRIKVMASLITSERRIPQDGRIHFNVGDDRFIDFRVNTLPTLYGEKIVMRILDSSSAQLGIDQLGFEPEQKQHLLSALAKPDGMILVTGPTGSGKTVTLYTGLNMLNTSEKNISTAEDPAEIQIAGINQVNVDDKVGLTFASALRAFLRQDPDIIMVGEIRDLETAEISIKAAQTGHLVLSTLHTNSAPETLTRLINMGIPPFNIASSLNLIVAQRLARRLCGHCKKEASIPKEPLLQVGFKEEELDDLKVFEPVGCGKCSKGYKGRVGIYQVMPISNAMGRIVMDGGNSMDLAEQAQEESINDLRQSALEKVRQGIISLQELERVTKE